MNLFNLATLIALLTVALQYIVNTFLADLLEERWREHGNSVDTARIKRNSFVRKFSWVILVFFVAAVVLGSLGIARN